MAARPDAAGAAGPEQGAGTAVPQAQEGGARGGPGRTQTGGRCAGNRDRHCAQHWSVAGLVCAAGVCSARHGPGPTVVAGLLCLAKHAHVDGGKDCTEPLHAVFVLVRLPAYMPTPPCRALLCLRVQTRTRRVPTALQDYQVEAVVSGTPEPPNIPNGHAAAGACVQHAHACRALAAQLPCSNSSSTSRNSSRCAVT